MDGPGGIGQGLMTGIGTGYWTTYVMLSPSSGAASRIYRTNDDWQTSSLVGGASVYEMELFASVMSEAMFYIVQDDFPFVRSIQEGIGSNSYWYDYFASGLLQVAPTGDTTCLMLLSTNGTGISLERHTPHTVELVHEFSDEHLRIDALSFKDQMFGLMLATEQTGGSLILATNDGGESWTQTASDTSVLKKVSWAPGEVVWVGGGNGTLLRSADHGSTWERVDAASPENVVSIAACGYDSAWVSTAGGNVVVTGNGGVTWTQRSIPMARSFELQAFEGVIYARSSGNALFKLTAPAQQGSSSTPSWRRTEQGIEVLLGKEVSLESIQLVDARGRVLRTGTNGPLVPMIGMVDGVYILRVRCADEDLRMKVLWTNP